MSFKCNNSECSAPENKKGKVYPSAMECPFCDEPLVAFESIDESDRLLINAWSSALNSNGNVMCLNFANGEIIERAPNFVHSFVPLVKLAPTNIKP